MFVALGLKILFLLLISCQVESSLKSKGPNFH